MRKWGAPRPPLHEGGEAVSTGREPRVRANMRAMATQRTILIIEDDASARQLVRLGVETQSYELLEASTGDEGLSVARAEHPDLILLDINMPGMSGLDVCRKLRAEGSLVPII